MTYDIKRTDGTTEWLIKTVRPNGTQSKKAMGESVVDMSFTLPTYVDFKINDFVVVYGETYKINVAPAVKKVARRKYEYTIQFEHLFYDLAKVQLQFLNEKNNLLEPVFNLMGNAATIVGLVVENANRHSPGWTVGVVDDTPYQNFSFNAENCLQVLNRMAADFETEFWIDNKTIHLQKREQYSGLQFEYGKGKGLYSILRSNKSNLNIMTRLYVRGGSRNLPLDYRNYATNLLLPNGATFIQDDDKVSPETGYGLIEATQIFEHIFPHREGTVSSVVAAANEWDKFTDSSLDFDINDYKLGTPAKVAFNTGQLAGYEFDISHYNHDTKQFTIIQLNDEALTVPNDSIRPAIGDKYVLLDIKMPQSYIDAAETKLWSAARAYYEKNSDPSLNFSYEVECDPIWFAQQDVEVVLGNTVTIYDVDLGIDGEIRIAGYKRDLQTASKYALEISDSIGANEIIRQYAQQQRTLQLLESSGLLDINQMRKNIFLNRLSEQNGYLMLSGNKIKAGIADYTPEAGHALLANEAVNADLWDAKQFDDYLNQPLRDTDEVAFKSVGSKNYVSGAFGSGFRINANGDAEFDNLVVRKGFQATEFVSQKVRASNGAIAITDSMVAKSVLDLGNLFFKILFENEGGQSTASFVVDDVVRCQVFTGSALRYISAQVVDVGDDYFTIYLDNATQVPQTGDTFVRLGNINDLDRQGLIYMTNADSGAPYIDVLDGVTSESFSGKTKVRLGKLDGIVDADLGALSGYGLYSQNGYFKGKIHVTGGNAETITGAQAKANAAQVQAFNDAYSAAVDKANAAQANAIAIAANDATAKANAAEANAQALVNAVKVGGRNLWLNSGNVTGSSSLFSLPFRNSDDLVEVTIQVWGIGQIDCWGDNGWMWYYGGVVGTAANPYGVKTFKVWANNPYGHANGTILFRVTSSSGLRVKWEEGNKPTDWTPAPEDVEAAVSAAQTAANAAQAANAALTNSLKAMAYKDVVELAELGSTVIQGGKIKTTLLDADFIKSNVINAAYVNTLELDASAIKSGTIDSARINAAQIVSNGGGVNQSFVDNKVLAASWASGRPLNPDVDFRDGFNGLSLYNNNGNGACTLQRLEKTVFGEVIPTSSTHALYFHNGNTGNIAQPGLGGFYFGTPSRPAAVFIARMVLAFEEGRTINFASNSYGDGAMAHWLTDNHGAGVNTFKEYVFLVKCGSTGSFSSTNFFYFDGAPTVSCRIASACVYDMSDAPVDPLTYAANRANLAQSLAISAAAADASAKANAAQASAQVMVNNLKVGGRNYFKKNTVISGYQLGYAYYDAAINGVKSVGLQGHSDGNIRLYNVIDEDGTYTISGKIKSNGDSFVDVDVCDGPSQRIYFAAYNWQSFSLTFDVIRNGYDFVDFNGIGWIYVDIANLKIEKGNKATDWTPAPEDVDMAISAANAAALAAQSSNATLAASLRAMAYKDVVELAELGSTIIEGGKIKTFLLDANYIQTHVINATYIQALDIVATKIGATQGYIGGFNIVNQSLIAGSNSDNPTAWDLNSSNIRLYTDFQLFRKIGADTSQTDELSINLGYYSLTTGLSYKDTLVVKNNILNTAQTYLTPGNLNGSGAIYRHKNRALVLEAKNSDENIALEVMSGHIYLRGVNDAGTANALRNGYIKYVNMNGRQVLVLDNNPTELNITMYGNTAQTASVQYGPCGSNEIGSTHTYTTPANTFKRLTQVDADIAALQYAQQQAQNSANNYGYCQLPQYRIVISNNTYSVNYTIYDVMGQETWLPVNVNINIYVNTQYGGQYSNVMIWGGMSWGTLYSDGYYISDFWVSSWSPMDYNGIPIIIEY